MATYNVKIETDSAIITKPITYKIVGADSYDVALKTALKRFDFERQLRFPNKVLPKIIATEYDPKTSNSHNIITIVGPQKTKLYTWSFETQPSQAKATHNQKKAEGFYIVTAWFDEHDAVPVALCSTEDKAKKAVKFVDEKATEKQREGEISDYSCHYEPMQLDVFDWFDIHKKL